MIAALLAALLPLAHAHASCRFVQNVDYATRSGFAVAGPTDQASCCAACAAHKLPTPCRAAVWVPAKKVRWLPTTRSHFVPFSE